MRKSLLLLSVCFLVVTGVKAFNLEEADAAAKGPKIVLNNGGVSINGTIYNQPWKIKSILNAFGGDYVEHDLSNLIFTFNQLGVHIYQYKKGDEANEIQLSFKKQSMKFAPSNIFKGMFKLGKLVIKKNTSIAKVQKTLPDYNFVKSSVGTSFRGEKDGVYIYINYEDETYKKVSYVSFGMTGRV